MDYLVTCDGIPIGTVTISVLSGLPHAELVPNDAYESVRDDAIRAMRRLIARGRAGVPGDFAKVFAQTWTAGRLALTDLNEVEVAVASVMIIHGQTPRVVVDARPDTARSGATVHPIDRVDGARSRPAA